MCQKHSFLMDRNGKIYDGGGLTHSHTEIASMHGFKSADHDALAAFEWQPPADWSGDKKQVLDGLTVDRGPQGWGLKASHDTAIAAYLAKKYPTAASFEAPDVVDPALHGKTITLGGKQLTVLCMGRLDRLDEGGPYLLAGGVRVTILSGTASVGRMYDTASVGRMYDTASVGEMYGTASVGEMYDTASVGRMYGTASVGRMYDTASVGEMYGTASVGEMSGTASVGRMYDTASVGRMYDTASVGRMYGTASVGRMYDTASVGRMYDTASVGEMYGTASVGRMYDTASVGEMYGTASVGEMYDTASVTFAENWSGGVHVDNLADRAVVIDRKGGGLTIFSAIPADLCEVK